jgi:hypothetical protein
MFVVTSPMDLKKESIEEILKDFFSDQALKVTQVSEQEKFLAENENFVSDIKRWDVTVTQQEIERQISFVIKTSSQGSFQKKCSTLWRPFAKELFWLKRGHPTLSKLCPELKSFSPICYYGFSTYEGRMFRPKGFLDQTPLVLLKMFTKKSEVGIILMENLKARDRPLKMLDKKKIMTPDQVRVVFQTLARLHGSWLKWKRLAEKEDSNQIRTRDIEGLTISMEIWKALLKSGTGKSERSISKLLRNQGKDEELIGRWQKYAKEKMFKRVLDFQSTKSEMLK